MPDIILADASGDKKTYEGVNALGVDTVDGGIAVYVSEDKIPSTTYKHPSTHPASMITGLAPVATNGTFEDLINKPFGDLKTILEEHNLTLYYDEEFELYCSKNFNNKGIIKGALYNVTWDGKEFSCICKDITDIDVSTDDVLFLGNLSLHPLKMLINGVDDTGEPFLICFAKNNEYGQYDTIHIISNDVSETHEDIIHTISIIPVENVKKIDAKYLPNETATKDWVKEQIARIALENEILKQTTFFSYGVANNFAVSVIPWEFIIDETYKIVFNGTEYTCVAYSVNSIGNASIDDSSSEDTGEPFYILNQGIEIFVLTRITSTDSPTIEIYHEEELIYRSGTLIHVENNMWIEMPIYAEVKYEEADTNYLVSFDEIDYDCVARCIDENEGIYVLGNASILNNIDDTNIFKNTGEPFCILILQLDTVFIACLVLTTETIVSDELTTHTIRIFKKSDIEVSWDNITNKPFFVEFDLTEMGLPSIPVNGSTVSTIIDTTKLINALRTGVVKVYFTIVDDSGALSEVNGILNAMYSSGCYNGGFITISNGIPIMFGLTVDENTISGQTITFVTNTTSNTTDE